MRKLFKRPDETPRPDPAGAARAAGMAASHDRQEEAAKPLRGRAAEPVDGLVLRDAAHVLLDSTRQIRQVQAALLRLIESLQPGSDAPSSSAETEPAPR